MIIERLTSRRHTKATRRNTRRLRPLAESLEWRQLLTLTPNQTFAALEQLQNQQALLARANGTINVGTFNAQSGTFAGLGGKSLSEIIASANFNRLPMLKPPSPVPITYYPTETYIDAVNVGLVFQVIHRQGDFTVTANDKTVSAAPGENMLTVNVGTSSRVTYTVSSGGKAYSGSFTIVRPPYIGVATIPIVPLAVVYDAPQGDSTVFTHMDSLSTTVSLQYSNSSSTTTPGTSAYGDLTEVENVWNVASKALAFIPTVGGAVSSVVSAVSGVLFGSAQATTTDGSVNATETTNGVTYTTTDTITPTTHLGPGEGDVIEFMTDERIVAVGWNGQVTLTQLPGGGQVWAISVHGLKQILASLGTSNAVDRETGLDRASIQALLNLDPLATGGPNAPLNSSRFVSLGTFGINGAQWTHTFSDTFSTSEMNSSTRTVENMEIDQAGWLAFLGLGVTQTRTTAITVTNASSKTDSASHTVSATVTLNAGANEYDNYQFFYDTVFGSILIQEVPAPPPPPTVKTPVIKLPIELHSGVFLAGATGRTPLVTRAEPTPGNAATAATSEPAQPPIRLAYVTSDPAPVPVILRRQFVRQDDI
jgi:hypothetical protein